MPLKIIHHRENKEIVEKNNKNNFNYDIEETLKKMYSLCDKIINFSHLILEKIDFDKSIANKDLETMENKIEEIQNYIKTFEIIFGKKLSIIEAVSKATSLIQKIQIIAEKFNISLIEDNCDENENIEYLTDDDIDMMVQMVKDFGEDNLRQDAESCKIEIEEERERQQIIEQEPLDVYDIYHSE